ncbi:DNA-binding protein [Microbacterium sp. 1P10UB]|uniref:DNA-binding protein n=1 Tax=unclassified Microbacterium TaxID=2609290 RepID=UPI0039A24237
MFVITADQRGSRTSDDLVPSALADVTRRAGRRLALAPDRNAGDEVQAATDDGRTALDVALHLVRTGVWSVGIGVGEVQHPLPDDIRAARGPAFIHARDAVDRAKPSQWRLALTAADAAEADGAEALIRLLLELRERRTGPGWEVADLLSEGLTQKEIAARLGITETAVSLRAKAAGLRAEEAAIPALAAVLDALNRRPGPMRD